MACVGAGVAAERSAFPAWLSTGPRDVFAVAGSVAVLLACVRAAFQQLAAHLAAADVEQPARLVLQRPLAACTRLLRKERAFRAPLVVRVAVVMGLGVAAGFGPFAWLRT